MFVLGFTARCRSISQRIATTFPSLSFSTPLQLRHSGLVPQCSDRWKISDRAAFARLVLVGDTTTAAAPATARSHDKSSGATGGGAVAVPGGSILHLCAIHLSTGNESVLNYLINTVQVPLGIKDANNGEMTALQLACAAGKSTIACKFIELCVLRKKNSGRGFASFHGSPTVEGGTDQRRFAFDDNINDGNRDGWTPLHFAAARNRSEVVAALLEHGANANAFNAHRSTPIMLAITSRSVEASLEILKSAHDTVDVNCTDDKGATCLHLCMLGGFTMFAVAKQLLEMGANINARDNNGQTPLFWGVQRGQGRMSALLLTQGADPTIPALHPACATAVHLSIVAKDEGMIKTYFLNAPHCGKTVSDLLSECVDGDGRTLLMTAAACGEPKVVQLLLDAAASADGPGGPAMREMLTATDVRNKTALMHAVLRGHASTAAILLKAIQETLLSSKNGGATKEGEYTPMQLLVQQLCVNTTATPAPTPSNESGAAGGATGWPSGSTSSAVLAQASSPVVVNALTAAVQQGMNYVAEQIVDMCAAILASSAHPDEAGSGSSSMLHRDVLCNIDMATGLHPLHFVAIHGNTSLLNDFLQLPFIDVSVRSAKDGSRPIHHAARCGKPDAVELLFLQEQQQQQTPSEQGGRQLNCVMVDSKGRTVLHWCIKGMMAVLREQFEGDAASRTLPYPFDLTAIVTSSYASMNKRHFKVLQFVLRHGGDFAVTDADGMTCVDYIKTDVLLLARYLQCATLQHEESEAQRRREDDGEGQAKRGSRKQRGKRGKGSGIGSPTQKLEEVNRDEAYFAREALEQVEQFWEFIVSETAGAGNACGDGAATATEQLPKQQQGAFCADFTAFGD